MRKNSNGLGEKDDLQDDWPCVWVESCIITNEVDDDWENAVDVEDVDDAVLTDQEAEMEELAKEPCVIGN